MSRHPTGGAAWRALIERLASDGAAAEVEPGRRIRAHFVDASGRRRRVDLVITPHEWEEIVDPVHGSFDLAIGRLREQLRHLPPHMGFLVHDQLALIPHTSPGLLPEEPLEPQQGGRWVASPPEDPRRTRRGGDRRL